MNQLERWYDVQLDAQTLPAKRFYGEMSRDVKLSEILDMMEVTSGLQFKIEGRKNMLESLSHETDLNVDRKSVVQGKSVSVHEVLGGLRIIQKNRSLDIDHDIHTSQCSPIQIAQKYKY